MDAGVSFATSILRSVTEKIGHPFIHVQHLVELSTIRGEYKVDPIADLRPACYAMIHRMSPALSIEQLKAYLKKRRILKPQAPP